jgi:hypothetical protein
MKMITLVFGLLISGFAFAQGVSVQGSVLDGDFEKEPLAFANVKVKGLDISAETSLDGAFELNLLEGKYTLVIDFIGYAPIEITDVVVSNTKVILNPVVLSTLKRTYDLASASDDQ